MTWDVPSIPQKPHLSPGGQKTSSTGQTPCSSVPTSSSGAPTISSGAPTSSSGVDTTLSEVQTSLSSGQTSSAGQTPCSSVPTSSSGGQTSSSSGLCHSHPLPSSPVTQNRDDSCNTESPLPNRGNCNCENIEARLQQLEHTVSELLPADGSFGKEHCELMGYLMGYLCILTGHRTIVLSNMTHDQAKDHLTEKERKEVAHSMCHDPNTAERYYEALPDKKMANQMRKLRMKALKEAFMKSSQDSDEKSEATSETSLDDGEGIYDDAHESSSSLSSGEKSTLKRRNKRLHGFSEPNYESSEDEPPSFPDPSHKSKKKLDFSMQSKKPSVHSSFSPSKCFVLVERMSKSIKKYYAIKRKSKYIKLAKEMEESLETPDEETPLPPGGGGKDISETPIDFTSVWFALQLSFFC
ncbi:hypothetical protein D5F01_LYC02118 [Larimichthys crocea]|uniref:Uncharacterized protein n=1 Tax=Larimichthys crocea TaxID=215358 RepID=A0A6G0J7F4_LARCR|nr:hypothetical protein D5F01_LYC02118 [Larimichthys crocea]